MLKIQSYIDRYAQLGITPSDTDEVKLKKRMLSFLPLIIGIAAAIWGGIYVLLGHYLSAAIPLTYSVISVINLWHFYKTKNLKFLQTTQLVLVLLLPFMLMWSLGGFSAGSYVMIWAFFAPIAAMAYLQHQKSVWFLGFIALVIFSALIDSTLIERVVALPQLGIEIFYVLNIIAGFSGIYFLIHYYMGEKEKRAQALLYDEHTKLIKKSDELAEAYKKLHQIATHDSLTGLSNRHLLLNQLEALIANAQQNQQKLALFFIDLDRFKQINDSLGHPIGDQVLVHIGKVLQEAVANTELVARLGGDEFILLIENSQTLAQLSQLAEKIIQLVQETIHLEDQQFQVTCSIGITVYPDDISTQELNLGHANTANTLLRNADTAMYQAKHEGKNNHQFYRSEMTLAALEKMTLEKNLRNAIERDEFIMYYQPHVNVLTGAILGMEALVRWNHPSKGLIPPFQFIPFSEEIGLIVQIDRIVMKKAMHQFAKWHQAGLNPGVLSLNLSVRQLQNRDCISKLSELIEQSGCETNWIELEMTEGQIMTNPQESIAVLESVVSSGVMLSVDDFGTGYSFLAYLKKLPIHRLKIDQSFIRDLPDDEDDISIVKAIIALANSMNLEITAEGVETNEQRDFLVANGCQHIQGYLYSKPLPAAEMETLLRSGSINRA